MMTMPTEAEAQRLREVFDLVKAQPNWKDPIDAYVLKSAATPEEIREAVAFFCGGFPKIAERPDNSSQWHVTGAGYYDWVGA